MASIKTSHPTECVLWKTENLSIEQLRQILEVITIYEDDSHLIRKLLRCKECGHLYFKEFYEEIDWSEGNDAQYTTWIPIDDTESGEELSKMSPLELLSYPSIRYDYPTESDRPTGPYWSCSRNESSQEKAAKKEVLENDKQSEWRKTMQTTMQMQEKEFTYTGKWPELFDVLFIQSLISAITLGIYYPWAFCHIRKWVLEHTYAEGRQLTFVGNGSELFGILIVQFLLTIVTVGIWAFLQIPTHKLLEFDVSNTKFA